MARPAHRGGRVDRHDLADYQPVEQMADRRQAQLDCRRRGVPPESLYPDGGVEWLHVADRGNAHARAPAEEVTHCAAVGPPGVWVADVGGEEFDEAKRGALAGGGDQSGQNGR